MLAHELVKLIDRGHRAVELPTAAEQVWIAMLGEMSPSASPPQNQAFAWMLETSGARSLSFAALPGSACRQIPSLRGTKCGGVVGADYAQPNCLTVVVAWGSCAVPHLASRYNHEAGVCAGSLSLTCCVMIHLPACPGFSCCPPRASQVCPGGSLQASAPGQNPLRSPFLLALTSLPWCGLL